MKQDFKDAGYFVTAYLDNSLDYSVTQLLERVFNFGIRTDIIKKYGYEYEVLKQTHGERELPYVTMKETISDYLT